MSEPRVFVLADRALNDVVANVDDEQWDMVMPAEFKRYGSDELLTLRQVVDGHAYDDAWVPDMLAGRTMDEVGKEAYRGDLLGSAPAANFAALVDKACRAAEAVEDLERTVHCSFGDFTTREYFWQVNMYRGLRAWDIAKVLGATVNMPDELVQGLFEEIEPNAEAWRAMGLFPPAVAVGEDAPPLDRLLGLTGRQPVGG